jgi:DNA processing protein
VNCEREIAAAALVGLPRATPPRLREALRACGGPQAVVDAITTGAIFEQVPGISAEILSGWQREIDVTTAQAALLVARRGTRALVFDDLDWPIDSIEASMPAILLVEGAAFEALTRPRVAVVGTRNPSPHGAADAREIGGLLADAGAVVVSGLAYGVDGAAHEGAIDAGGLTIGVAGTGLDVPYPSGHAGLWARVREHGVIIGENPFGTQPRRHIFPVRNRIIAGLSSAVVIVEAAVKGGAMHTARAALALDRTVLAVPGSRRNPMAEGCNLLIADGAAPLIDPLDIAVAVELASGRVASTTRGHRHPLSGMSPPARAVFRALAGEPATLDQVVGRTKLAVATVAGAARELERVGRLKRSGGRLWPM